MKNKINHTMKSNFKLLRVGLLLGFTFFFAPQLFAQHLMTPELLWQLKRVGANGLSSNGLQLFYTQSSVDLKTEKRASEKYKVDIATGKSTELTESDYAVFQRNNGVSYALKAKKVYQSKDEKNWTFLADLETGAENISVAPNGKCMAYSKPVHVENILSKDIYSD